MDKLHIDAIEACADLNTTRTHSKNGDKELLHLGKNFNNNYLTKRELQVLKLLMFGYTAKKIGLELNISHRTVEDYIYVLKDKFDCKSKSDITVKAIKNGLVYLIFK